MDASAIGHFSYIVNSKKTMLASRAFSEEERKETSTCRELTTFKDTWTNPDILKRFVGTGIMHYTDNEAMVHVLARGSRNARLYPLVVKTILDLRKYTIRMKAVWMSRNNKVINFVDSGSRDFHADDICLE